MTQAISGNSGGFTTVFTPYNGDSSAGGATGSDALSNAAVNLVIYAVSEILGGDKTSVSSHETERSREAESSFRQSRSQRQAALTREAERGQRNL